MDALLPCLTAACRGPAVGRVVLCALVLMLAGCDSGVSPATLMTVSTQADASIPASCDTPPSAAVYRALAQHRADVLRVYAQNGWDPQARCHQIYDDWLAHGPDGKPTTTAQAFVAAAGWLTSSSTSTTSTSAAGTGN
jgi:hypothetical protein